MSRPIKSWSWRPQWEKRIPENSSPTFVGVRRKAHQLFEGTWRRAQNKILYKLVLINSMFIWWKKKINGEFVPIFYDRIKHLREMVERPPSRRCRTRVEKNRDVRPFLIMPGEGEQEVQRTNTNIQRQLGDWCATEEIPPGPGIEPETSPFPVELSTNWVRRNWSKRVWTAVTSLTPTSVNC